MNKSNTDVYVLQILVSDLLLNNPPRIDNYENKAIAPVINIKVNSSTI